MDKYTIARLAIWIWIFQPGRKGGFKRTLCVCQEEFSVNCSIDTINAWAEEQVHAFRGGNSHIHHSDVLGTLTLTTIINP